MATTSPGSIKNRQPQIGQIEQQVAILGRRLRRALTERAQLINPELSGLGYFIFANLAKSGASRSSVLAEVFGLDKAMVSRQVQHLIDLGLINKIPDPADGRAALLEVSSQGQAKLAAVSQSQKGELAARLGDWTEAELTDFVNFLIRFNLSLD